MFAYFIIGWQYSLIHLSGQILTETPRIPRYTVACTVNTTVPRASSTWGKPCFYNMGQKLSGFTLTMEEEDVRREVEEEKAEANGNSEVDQHFEMIYSSRNEPSTSSSDVINGNTCNEEQCSSRDPSCSCAVKSKAKTGAVARKRPDEIVKRSALRTVTFTSGKKSRGKRTKDNGSGCASVKKRPHWGLRLNCAGLKQDADIPEGAAARESGCVCTGYRRTAEPSPPAIDLSRFNPHDFPIEDCDERARLERAREMAEGVEPPPGFPGFSCSEINLDSLAMFFQARLGLHAEAALTALTQIDVGIPAPFPRMHSQADFIHCLVPDLLQITCCSFYWGKMDRYEAERLLEGRPEGTFLLRDSAQEEFLFSVSFRKYGRSLHARIEQWNHRFSFDSHDPGVYSSPTVCGLIEHYKDSSFCMFFEPMLTIPLNRNFTFPLQHLCRAAVCSRTDYDSISRLLLPKALKSYLREYHYKQRVRIRNLDIDF